MANRSSGKKRGKVSMTFNGWDGGLNVDKDASDIIAKGDGKDELTSLKRAFIDIPGKIRAAYPDVENSSSMTPSSPDTNTDDSTKIVANNDKIYHQTGAYKFEDKVNWRYNPQYLVPAHQTGIWQETTVMTADDGGTNGKFSNSMHIWARDGSENARKLVIFRSKTASSSNFWSADTIMCPTYDSSNNTVDMTDDVFQGSGRYFCVIQDSTSNGPLNPSDGSGGTASNEPWEDQVGFPPSTANFGTSSHWCDIGSGQDFVLMQGTTAYSSSGLATTLSTDIGAATEISMHGVGNDDASAFMCWKVGYGEETSGGNYNGIYGMSMPNIKDRDLVIEMRIGFSGEGYNSGSGYTEMIDKLKYLVICCSSEDDVNPWDQVDWVGGDAHQKLWQIPKADLEDYGCIDGIASFTIPYDAGTEGASFDPTKVRFLMFGLGMTTGSNYNMGTGKTTGNSTEMFKLYEFSFAEKSSGTGWGGKHFSFWSTQSNNEIESLPTQLYKYGPSHADADINRIFSPSSKRITIQFMKPHADHPYQEIQKLYYQETDADGVASSEKFLLATIDRTNGIKKAGENTYEAWGSNTNLTLEFDAPPIETTYLLESGYPEETTCINYVWQHATVVGKQVYIGNVQKLFGSATFRGDNLADINDVTGESFEDDEGIVMQRTSTEIILSATAGSTGLIIDWTSANDKANYGFVAGVSSPIVVKWHSGGDISNYPNGWSGTMTNINTDSATNDRIIASGIPTAGQPDDAKTDITTVFQFSNTVERNRILKSPPGKIGGFSDLEYIDIDTAGDAITCLESSGDRLLVFTDNNLAIINVAQDIEFMEGEFSGYGITLPKQVCKIGEGVAFVNRNGVYLFDGSKIVSLSQDKMSSITWDAGTHRPAVTYDEKSKLLWVWVYDGSSGYDVYYFSLKLKSWVGKRLYSDIGAIPPITNSVVGKDQKTYYCIAGSSNQIKNIKNSTGTTAGHFEFETGEIDFGNITSTKKFYKIVIQVKNAQNIELLWKTDVSGSYDSGTDLSSGVNEIDITGSTAKGKWIQLKVATTGGTTQTTCEIEDISVIYRELGVR